MVDPGFAVTSHALLSFSPPQYSISSKLEEDNFSAMPDAWDDDWVKVADVRNIGLHLYILAPWLSMH